MNIAHIFGRFSRLDLGTALLAAFSACFVAYAAPDWRLGQVIGALSLDSLVPAFQPPLGNKIRILFMLAGAGAAFSGVLALMHFLDRVPAKRRTAAAAAEDAPEPIRLRRVDFHPDAGVRRPLQPGRDIGEPEEMAQEPPAGPAPKPVAEPEAEPEKPRVFGSKVAPEPEPEPEPLELAVVADAVPEPEPLELTVHEEPAPPIEPEAPAPAPQPFALAPEPEPEKDEDQSLTKLMRRLERGVHKREQALPQAAAEAAPAPPPAEEPAGHRLRSAISDLQKLAARGA